MRNLLGRSIEKLQEKLGQEKVFTDEFITI